MIVWIFVVINFNIWLSLVFLVLSVYQIFQIESKRFKFFYLFFIAILYFICFLLSYYSLISINAIFVFKIYLLLSGAIKFIGHTFELIPPYVIKERFDFHTLKISELKAKHILLPIFGICAEFTAGMPFRLPSILAYRTYLKLGNKSDFLRDVDAMSKKAVKFGHKDTPFFNDVFEGVTKTETQSPA